MDDRRDRYTDAGVTMTRYCGVGTDRRAIQRGLSCVAGVLVPGATEQEALENIRIAIQEYLAAVRHAFEGAEAREVEVAV